MQSNFIFISGGNCYASSVERYNSSLDIWEDLPDLNQARRYHSSCIIGNTMYVVGGKSQGQAINSTEKLNDIDAQDSQASSQW